MKCDTMYVPVLINMLIRRKPGFFFRMYPKIKVKMTSEVKGIRSNLPASVYLKLNLETINSFRLSLKGPRDASVKKMKKAIIQNLLLSFLISLKHPLLASFSSFVSSVEF